MRQIVVLVPKVSNPEKVRDLRSISLCNVLYKIASKVLSNRLQMILPEIISQNQCAFMPGRLITDNVLIAYELNSIPAKQEEWWRQFCSSKA